MRWIPLESNPEVMNSWAKAAGLVTSQYEFGDIYGLDKELLAMVSGPVKAVILLFPISGDIEAKRTSEEKRIAKEGQYSIDPTVFWMKQTISNACGTMGIIHALANANITFVPESPIAKFIDECKDKTPEERAKILETTPLFADIHSAAASSGQTETPDLDFNTDLHFTCFVQAPDEATAGGEMRLIELDGTRAGPVDRGVSRDLLTDAAKIVKEFYIAQSSSPNFSMISLGPSPVDTFKS